jgi:cytochrome c oxidase subunit 4
MRPIIYTSVFGVLALTTIIEVQIAQGALAKATVVAAIMSLASLKGLLIALFYMHLKYERRTLTSIALPPLVLLIILLTSMIVG